MIIKMFVMFGCWKNQKILLNRAPDHPQIADPTKQVRRLMPDSMGQVPTNKTAKKHQLFEMAPPPPLSPQGRRTSISLLDNAEDAIDNDEEVRKGRAEG